LMLYDVLDNYENANLMLVTESLSMRLQQR
jgi:hypothetical protein